MWKVANFLKNGGRSSILRNCPGQSTASTETNDVQDALFRHFSNSSLNEHIDHHKNDSGDRRQGPSSSNNDFRHEDGDECNKEHNFNFKDSHTDSRWFINSVLFGLPAAFLSTTLQYRSPACPFVQDHKQHQNQMGWFSHLSLLPRFLFSPKLAQCVLSSQNQTRAISYVPNNSSEQQRLAIDSSINSNDIASQTDLELDIFHQKQSIMTKAGDHLENANRYLIGSFENMIGLDLLNHGLRTEAFQHFVRSSEMDHPIGAYNLGMCYYKGYGTRPNDSKAVTAWQKAADLGNSSAKYQIGISHIQGLGGLPIDRNLGQKYISDAAKDNLPEAQNFMGSCQYKTGEVESSRKYFEAAAARGNKMALAILSKVCKPPPQANNGSTLKTSQHTDVTKVNSVPKQKAKFWAGGSDEDNSDDESRQRPTIKSSSDTDSDSDWRRFDDSTASSTSSVVFYDESTKMAREENESRKLFADEAEDGKLKAFQNTGTTFDSLKCFLADLMEKTGSKNSVDTTAVKKAHSVADFRDKNVFI